MSIKLKLLSTAATVDARAILPLPNSRKIYVEGSRPDIRVAMREISQSDTAAPYNAEKTHQFMSMTALGLTPIPKSASTSVPVCKHRARHGLLIEATVMSYPARVRLLALSA